MMMDARRIVLYGGVATVGANLLFTGAVMQAPGMGLVLALVPIIVGIGSVVGISLRMEEQLYHLRLERLDAMLGSFRRNR